MIGALALVVAPVSAAETYRVRATGIAIQAQFTNLPDKEEWETLPPGDYFFTTVIGSSLLATGSEEFEENQACVFHDAFSVDLNGELNWTPGVFVCGAATTIKVDRRLQTGRLVATLPVIDCTAWDETTGECLELVELGSVEIDLTLAGTGPIQRQHHVSTGGTAGLWTYSQHSTGADRTAIPSGTVMFNDESLINGAATIDAQLTNATGGWVEVTLGG